jgi:hypothetical protein
LRASPLLQIRRECVVWINPEGVTHHQGLQPCKLLAQASPSLAPGILPPKILALPCALSLRSATMDRRSGCRETQDAKATVPAWLRPASRPVPGPTFSLQVKKKGGSIHSPPAHHGVRALTVDTGMLLPLAGRRVVAG